MSFLPFVHTYLLYFLPLAAVPIVLHLLTLHRLRTVELSTFRFLFDSYVQQRRKMKFLEALIAALRTLFLLLLIAAVARPAVRHWDKLFGSGGGQEVVMLMDTSVSMNTTTAGKSALDRAKSAALAIVEKLGPDDRLTLVRVGSRPEEVFSRFAADSASIRDKIESLRASSSRANMLATLTQTFGPQAPRAIAAHDLPVHRLSVQRLARNPQPAHREAAPRQEPLRGRQRRVKCGRVERGRRG